MHENPPGKLRFVDRRVAVVAVVVLLACLRLCHVHLLWADEDYHLAAAIQILHGKVPYRDFWYDKPPGNALYYLLIGGYPGWPLRILDAIYVMLAGWLAYRLARAWWGEQEGRLAAIFLAFFLAFYLPSATIAFAADALMIVPQLGAIYYAFTRRAFLAGVWCALAFLVNAKALFVLAVCGLWLFGAWPMLALGFAIPLLPVALLAVFTGAWSGYCEQVWRWGWIYAGQSPVLHPVMVGLVRSLDWLGFHAALAGGVLFELLVGTRGERWKLGSWLVLSFAAVCLGTRFAPHYFLQLLPAMAIGAARGVILAFRRNRMLAALFLSVTLLVPFARFGPRYAEVAYDAARGLAPRWNDVLMDLDAQDAARVIRSAANPADSLFVWGYRPDIYVYTRLISDGKFWDSQPLTGVPADRHLHAKEPIYGGPAAVNRRQIVKTKPTWLVDGLGLLNPSLRPEVYPELRPWLKHYKMVARIRLSAIYHRIE